MGTRVVFPRDKILSWCVFPRVCGEEFFRRPPGRKEVLLSQNNPGEECLYEEDDFSHKRHKRVSYQHRGWGKHPGLPQGFLPFWKNRGFFPRGGGQRGGKYQGGGKKNKNIYALPIQEEGCINNNQGPGGKKKTRGVERTHRGAAQQKNDVPESTHLATEGIIKNATTSALHHMRAGNPS